MPAPTPNPGLNTNSGLGPGPGLIIPSPSGVITRFAVNGWSPTGTGNYGPVVVSPAIGGVSLPSTGELSLTGYYTTGSQGTLDVVFTTGTAGTVQHVAAILDKSPTPVGYLGVFLDTQNRPYVVVTDATGTIVAETSPLGPAVPAGTMLHAFIEWNSGGAISGPDLVAFEVGETALENWGKEPLSPWPAFQPTVLSVGVGFASYGSFTGKIGNVQLGNGISPFVPPQVSASHSVSVGILGSATVAAAVNVQHKSTAHPSGLATVTASATVAGP